MKRRTISILLCALLVSQLIACGQKDESTEKEAEATSATETTATLTPETDAYGREMLSHSLPESLDFGGVEVFCIVRDNPSYSIDFGVEEMTGEIVNDAILERNNRVENDLNLAVRIVKAPDTNTTTTESVGDEIRQSAMAGDGAYDVCGVYQIYGASLATEGLLFNLHGMPHFDFSKPWWNQSFVEELTYKNQLYFTVGSMNLSVTSSLMAYYFNQDKITDYYQGYDFLYELVYNGEWTYDKLIALVSGVYTDLNDNGKQDENDFYGLLMKEDDPGPINAALGIELVKKDDAGIPQISFYNERSVDAYGKLYTLYRKTDGVFFGPKSFDWCKAFNEGRGLFACCSLESAGTQFRDMEDGYGILPMPKYDENQQTYYNAARDSSNLTGIVTSTQKAEAAAAMLELMNYYAYYNVVPAYYEVAMKAKYLADSDSANMFDLIVNNVRVDFGQLYSLAISGGTYTMEGIYAGKMRNMIRQNVENIASNWAQFEQLYKNCLTELLAKFDELG